MKLKRMKTIFIVILMVLSTLTIGIAAEATFMKNEQRDIKNDITQPLLFDVEITFTIQTGEGCGCDPIPGVLINAFGGEGSAQGITDEDGICVLTLVIGGEYEVLIEPEDYQTVDFEFDVVDEQTFIFHMFEKEESSIQTTSLLYNIFSKLVSK